jgi:hypothetical protein
MNPSAIVAAVVNMVLGEPWPSTPPLSAAPTVFRLG